MLTLRKAIAEGRAGFVRKAAALITVVAFGFGPSMTSGAVDRTRPTKPTNFRVTAKTAYNVSLAWSPSTDNSGQFSYVLASTGNPSARVTLPKIATSYTFNSG